jgi:hypothetical protein
VISHGGTQAHLDGQRKYTSAYANGSINILVTVAHAPYGAAQ